ncbi:MAG: hypothetical protein IT349_10055 [Candidatus Eisenbacteria bacterium]|nr:hypothetical protein [Candidatus Eisenbacteria bacterium]
MRSLENVERIRERTEFDRKAQSFVACGGMSTLASFSGMSEAEVSDIIHRQRVNQISDIILLLEAMEVLADSHALERIRDVRAYVKTWLSSEPLEGDEAGACLDEKDIEQIELLRRSMVGVLDRRLAILAGRPGG